MNGVRSRLNVNEGLREVGVGNEAMLCLRDFPSDWAVRLTCQDGPPTDFRGGVDMGMGAV